MIKAAAGGGGRGIRIAHDVTELERLMPQASAEALAAFGDGGLYVEKLIERARHIEVQVLGDGDRAVHCFERECSLQRRHQKVWEEAPSAALPQEVRKKLCASAVALALAVNYRGAGTVEYLYDDDTKHFYFLEMNTRIQVEHPVTEMITGIDLVREMIRIAAGEPLRLKQDDLVMKGMPSRCASMRRTRQEILRLFPAPSRRFAYPADRARALIPCCFKAIRCRRSTIPYSENLSCGTRRARRLWPA